MYHRCDPEQRVTWSCTPSHKVWLNKDFPTTNSSYTTHHHNRTTQQQDRVSRESVCSVLTPSRCTLQHVATTDLVVQPDSRGRLSGRLHAQLEISGYKGGDAVSLVGTKLCRSVTVHNTALYTVGEGLRGRSIPQSVAID